MSIVPNSKIKVLTILPAIIGSIALFMASLSIFLLGRAEETQRAKDCARVVAGREDSRAVWLHILTLPGVGDRPGTQDFKTFLDSKLPPLECVNNFPTPKKEHK